MKEKIQKCHRRRFTYRNLYDSGSFYTPVVSRVEKLQILLYPESELSYLKSYTYCSLLFYNIIGYNRCFQLLAKAGELSSAYPLIRLQADNLKILVAEYMYPNKILSSLYDKGKELTDIKIKGEQLKASEINDAVEEMFTGYKEIYQKYSLYIHPSEKHNLRWLNRSNKDEEALMRKAKRTIKRSPAQSDMILVNQFIEDLMINLYTKLLAEIRADKEKFKAYRKWEQFSFSYIFSSKENEASLLE
jgi:hypothetical protein